MAAAIPAEASATLWRGLSSVRDSHPGVRWLAPETFHITLVFIGDTHARRVPQLGAALGDAASVQPVFEAATGAAGGRVDRRAAERRGGVAWLTLSRGAVEMASLAREVDRSIHADAHDQTRTPRPHLTIARRIDEGGLQALATFAASDLSVAWSTTEIVLFRSHLGSGGPDYEPLVTHRLKGGSL